MPAKSQPDTPERNGTHHEPTPPLAAAAFLLGPAIYLAAEAITAAAWKSPGYSYTDNWISDWGAVVTTALGAMQPEGLPGIHLNTQFAFPAQMPDTLSPEQRHAVETLALYAGDLGGFTDMEILRGLAAAEKTDGRIGAGLSSSDHEMDQG